MLESGGKNQDASSFYCPIAGKEKCNLDRRERSFARAKYFVLLHVFKYGAKDFFATLKRVVLTRTSFRNDNRWVTHHSLQQFFPLKKSLYGIGCFH
jgi:hypothetical protein